MTVPHPVPPGRTPVLGAARTLNTLSPWLTTLLLERSPVHTLCGSVVTLCFLCVFFWVPCALILERLALAPNSSLGLLLNSGGAGGRFCNGRCLGVWRWLWSPTGRSSDIDFGPERSQVHHHMEVIAFNPVV